MRWDTCTHEKLVVTPLQNWRNLVQAYSVLWRLSPSAWKCLAKGKVKVKAAHSCLTLCDPMEYSPWNSPGQNTAVGSCSLLQWIFPTQASNPGLPHCRQILYKLSHKGSPRILEWVVYPFSSESSRSRNRTRVSCTAGVFFTNWAIREAHKNVW